MAKFSFRDLWVSGSDTFSIHDFIKIGRFWAVTWLSSVLEILWVWVWDTFSFHESIRIGRFLAVTWPSLVFIDFVGVSFGYVFFS